MRILTWHVHGNYLLYLSRLGHELVLPVRPGRPHPYGGRAGAFPWPDTVVEVDADGVGDEALDAVLYQSREAWQIDRFELLSDEQRALPAVYLEHDPPRESAFDTPHHVRDPSTLVVHVTSS